MSDQHLTQSMASLAEMPDRFEAAFHLVPAAAWHWEPSSWDGIPGEMFSAAGQACHVRDIEIDGYGVRIRRMIEEDRPDLVSIDGYELARDRGYAHTDPLQAIADFRAARRATIDLLSHVEEPQLERRGTFAEYGEITLRGLIHYLCSHDQQHLACLQWLLGRLASDGKLLASSELPPSDHHLLQEPPMSLIETGKKAPAFTLKDQNGEPHKLSAYAGRPVVLYFYPKDDTPGCTQESCDFQDRLPKFKKSKAVVLGISILDEKSKARFAAKHSLTFPLLADADHAVAEKYGVWQEKSRYGRTYMGIARTTYLIDAKGKVAKRWDGVRVSGHAEEVLREAEAL